MSELINTHDNRATIRWKLLTGASALVLTAYVSSADMARAEDSHPLFWLEFSGDASVVSGEGQPFAPPFVHADANPGVFDPVSPLRVQKPPPFSFGGETTLSFQPEDSNWIFSAGVRFGRSNSSRITHQQTQGPLIPTSSYYYQYFAGLGVPIRYASGFLGYAEFRGHNREHHTILDFQAGRDVGLGLFGHNGTSVVSAGVRIAQFNSDASILIRARPDLVDSNFAGIKYDRDFHHYYLSGSAQRSFHGIGPSVSWSNTVPLAGNLNDGELAFDWGVTGALLFGKQRTKAHHYTSGYHNVPTGGKYHQAIKTGVYHHSGSPSRSRNVTVPNIGGYAAIAYRFQDAKVSLGYRYDTFLNAIDTGIDTAKKSAMTFNGPYASISIGLGD